MSDSKNLPFRQTAAGNLQRYTLRVNRAVFQKFRYIAQYEGRSANKAIERYIKERVAKFESIHGVIDTNDLSEC